MSEESSLPVVAVSVDARKTACVALDASMRLCLVERHDLRRVRALDDKARFVRAVVRDAVAHACARTLVVEHPIGARRSRTTLALAGAAEAAAGVARVVTVPNGIALALARIPAPSTRAHLASLLADRYDLPPGVLDASTSAPSRAMDRNRDARSLLAALALAHAVAVDALTGRAT